LHRVAIIGLLPSTNLWQSFLCTIVAAMTFQPFNLSNLGKLVLLQVHNIGQVWRTFKLIPWVFVKLWAFFGPSSFSCVSAIPAQILSYGKAKPIRTMPLFFPCGSLLVESLTSKAIISYKFSSKYYVLPLVSFLHFTFSLLLAPGKL
jgi:hypothetical protein